LKRKKKYISLKRAQKGKTGRTHSFEIRQVGWFSSFQNRVEQLTGGISMQWSIIKISRPG